MLACEASGVRYAIQKSAQSGFPDFVSPLADASSSTGSSTDSSTGSSANSSKSQLADSFEQRYRNEGEPWSYSDRAAEMLRHEYVTETTERLRKTHGSSNSAASAASASPARMRLLDLGCSNGQLTYRLGQAFGAAQAEIFSLDISPTAVQTAQEAVRTTGGDFFFLAASATELPFAGGVFDMVVVSDGLHGWELPPDLQRRVLAEVHRVLKPSGYAIFTDYLHPKKYDELEAIIRQSPLHVEAVEYLYDRFWYRMESLTRALHGLAPVRALLRSVSVARGLKRLARLRGKHGSKHICIITRRTD
jgi:ubiquinone/menaquinone biosynthesis C-methylase UbiE